MVGMITVAIIEDNRLVCECMRDMLDKVPDVKVVLASTSLETAMLKEANPRVVTDTVKSHVRNVMEKLALHTRLQISAYAHDQDE